MTEDSDTYVLEDGSSFPQVSDMPDAKMYLCFNTKSGDFVRLAFIPGEQKFILTKEFLDAVATERGPVPGFPDINGQRKRLWVELDYKPPEVKEESIVHFDTKESQT